jgi:RND family efflux transporter MFP subunit
MKKVIFISIVALVIAGIIGILAMNKKSLDDKKKQTVNMSEFPVDVEQVKMEKLDDKLALIGNSMANAEVNVLSETQGRIIALHFDIGSKISKGSVLAKVDDELKHAALLTAEATVEKAKKDYDRTLQLYNQKSANEAQLDQAKFSFKTAEAQLITAKRQYNDTKIVSPVSGVVTVKSAENGSYLNIGTPIATIIDVNSLKVRVNVSEKNIGKVKAGDQVRLKTEVYPGKEFAGSIKTIIPKADESHTYPVEISIKNNGCDLKAGMFFNVYFDKVEKGESIVIPRQSLIGGAKDPRVFVVDQSGIAKERKISIAQIIGDKIEVNSGLNVGELVVINGQLNLNDNTKVKIVNK